MKMTDKVIFFHFQKYWIFLRLNSVVKETGTVSE